MSVICCHFYFYNRPFYLKISIQLHIIELSMHQFLSYKVIYSISFLFYKIFQCVARRLNLLDVFLLFIKKRSV
ncbi:membrane protein [Lactococcus lactis subsp. lactis IO-1]|nr:membrane protein [Lactococcus lactis subsp. lactis IO-1]